MDDSLDPLLDRLEQIKHRFDAVSPPAVENLLRQLERRRFRDAESLVRFHEALLFLRAYPHNRRVLTLTERILTSFEDRVDRLRDSMADLTPLDYIENSGIAGTTLSGTWSYGIVRCLVRRWPARVEIDWDHVEKKQRLGGTLPRFVPLMEDDSLVEANIPYLTWLRTAKGRGGDLEWLMRSFDRMPCSEREKAEIYELLELPIRWELGDSASSRTLCKHRIREVFYQKGPLIRRNEVSLEREFASAPLHMTRLSRVRGQAMQDMLREVTAVRYRELYGITYGDPDQVVRFAPGRGLEIFLWGLAVERRLPLRAYHAGFTLKNGVPVNYIEGISLFERMELGFNTFYTFRDGESGWVYANVLRALNQVAGATCFSIDPYQLGFNNDEAIESGAFWFYRKLGFRPVRPDIARLVESEEQKISRNAGYRTSAQTLRRLSAAPAVYEAPNSPAGDWDRFHVRNLGLAVARRTAREFAGDATRARAASVEAITRALEVEATGLGRHQKWAFDNLALVLALIPDLRAWTEQEKRRVVQVIRAKAGRDEARYLRLLVEHARLRRAIIKLGSSAIH